MLAFASGTSRTFGSGDNACSAGRKRGETAMAAEVESGGAAATLETVKNLSDQVH